jgi:hypothetical protein
MLIDRQAGVWDTRRADKARRLARAAPLASGKVIPTQKATEALDALLECGDKVILEGDNQKQADFLSRSLAAVDPGRVHDVHLLISPFSRPEQLDLFEDGIASRTDFAYAGAQSFRVRRCWPRARCRSARSTPTSSRLGGCSSICSPGWPGPRRRRSGRQPLHRARRPYAWVACLSTNWHSA